MKLNAYVIYDAASASYQRPFFVNADGAAIRAFGDLTKDQAHPIGQHPEDYSLHRIGTFDDNNAKFNTEDKECLITGLEAASQNTATLAMESKNVHAPENNPFLPPQQDPTK